MAHFTYTRSGGVWNTLPVAYSELAELDAKTYKAINGDEGGTWAPSSAIVIGGSGLTVVGAFVADGSFLVTSGGTIQNGLTTTGTLNCQNNLTVGGNATFAGNVDVTGSLNAGELVSTGNATIVGNLDINGGISAGDSITTTESVVANGNVTAAFGTGTFQNLVVSDSVSGSLYATTWISAGGGMSSGGVLGANTNTSYGPLNYHDVYITSGGLTADRTYEVPAVGAGAENGNEMVFTSDNTTYIVDINVASGGANLANLQGPPGFGRPRSIRIKVIGGAWRVMNREYLP